MAASFNVRLSPPSGKTVTAGFTTVENTANQFPEPDGRVDYVFKSGSLTFVPGEVEKSVVVEVVGDEVGEADEIFYLNIPTTQNAIFVRPGTGTILNDDAAIFIRGTGGGDMFTPPNSTTVDEGPLGTKTNADFLVVLQGHNDLPVTAQFETAPCSATDGFSAPCGGGSGSGPDYVRTSDSVTFEPGDGDVPGGTSKVVSVPVLGDDEAEDTYELFEARLINVVGADFARGPAFTWGVIRDDDQSSGPDLSPHLPDRCGGSFVVSAFCTISSHEGGVHIVIIEGTALPNFVSVSLLFTGLGQSPPPEHVASCTGFRSCRAVAVVLKPTGDWVCLAGASDHGGGNFSCSLT